MTAAANQQSEWIIDGPKDAQWTVVLAHGAGVAMDTPFMAAMAGGLGAAGIRVVRFEFPYMARRRKDGRRRPPDREAVLRSTWQAVIKDFGIDHLIIGGKSLGGRIASLIADESRVRGLICLGYPFHPTGKPDRLRIEHLQDINTTTLIVQGTRDPFGNELEVAAYPLSAKIQIQWLPDGDHSFRPRKTSGRTEQENLGAAVRAMIAFIHELAE